MKFSTSTFRSITLYLSLLLLFSCNQSSKPTLHLFIWANTFDPEIVASFEEKFQCHVVMDTFDSNESMFAKLQLAPSSYDIIFPSNYFIELLKKQDMVQPINLKLIPNSTSLDPKYFSSSDTPFSIPYLISFSGIAYRTDKVKNVEASWTVFSRSDLKGRMTMLNDIREALGAALKTLGYSINSRNPTEIDASADLLISWKHNLAKFENEQYRHGIASGEFLVVQGYSTDIMQVREENKNVMFAYPKEGAILSIDSLAIPKSAKEPILAHAFLNFVLESKNVIKNIEHTNTLIPTDSAYSYLEKSKKDDFILFPPKQDLEKIEKIEDLDSDLQLYYKAWERVKNS